MEILKNLSKEEMDALKDVFESSSYHRALTPKEFRRELWRVSQSKEELLGCVSKRYLRHLFANIDVAGTGYVSWGDFTMFAIDQARNVEASDGSALSGKQQRHRKGAGFGRGARSHSAESLNASEDGGTTKCSANGENVRDNGRSGAPLSSSRSSSSSSSTSSSYSSRTSPSAKSTNDAGASCSSNKSGSSKKRDWVEYDEYTTFQEYHVDHIVPQRYGVNVLDLKFLPRLHKLVFLSTDLKHSSSLLVYNLAEEKTALHGALPRNSEPITAWDYIPATGGVCNSNTLACAYNGGQLRLYSLEKKQSFDETLPLTKAMPVSESQTALLWSTMYGRLMMGSRGGVVSTWDVDDDKVSSQEKLHSTTVTALRIHSGSTLFSASLDKLDSVKGVDLERSVVRFAFNDHLLGGATCLELDEEFYFSTGFEPRIVQRLLQTPKAHPSYLYDTLQPHKGRISSLYRIPNSPVLVSGDTRGTVKLWDLRMGNCLQTLTSTTLSSVQNKVLASAEALTAAGEEGDAGGFRKLKRQGGDSTAMGDGENFIKAKKEAAVAYQRSRDRRIAETYRSGANAARGRPPANPGLGTKAGSASGTGMRTRRNQANPYGSKADGSCVNALCYLPTINQLFVATETEVIALSNDKAACPHLVDDERPCRFILFPGEDQILTVHERAVKLWDATTGYVVYCSENDLVNDDVSACALVQPLQRQFVLGTMSGEVAGFSVSLAQKTIDFAAVLQDAGITRRGNQILSLYTLAKLRGSQHPYVVVVTADTVDLAPMVTSGGCRASQLVTLHTVRAALTAQSACIKDTHLLDTTLYVATTTNTVLLFDLHQNGALIALFNPPATTSIESICVGRFLVGPPPSIGDEKTSTSLTSEEQTCQAALFFTPDNGGKILVGGKAAPLTAPDLCVYRMLGEWSASAPSNDEDMTTKSGASAVRWRWHRQGNTQCPDRYGYLELGGTSHAQTTSRPQSRNDSASNGEREHSVIRSREGGGGLQRDFSLTLLASELLPKPTGGKGALPFSFGSGGKNPGPRAAVITHVHYFEGVGVVVTGDERGHVRVWDLLAVAELSACTYLRLPAGAFSRGEDAAPDPGRSSRREQLLFNAGGRGEAIPSPTVKPRFIAGWDAHTSGFTALEGMQCPLTGLPIIVSAGVDRKVCLWSADGAPLGSLAMGRQVSEASGGHRYDLDAYVITAGAPVAAVRENWCHFQSAMDSRVHTFIPDTGRSEEGTVPAGEARGDSSPSPLSLHREKESRSSPRRMPSRGTKSGTGESSFFVTEVSVEASASDGALSVSPGEKTLTARTLRGGEIHGSRLNCSVNTASPVADEASGLGLPASDEDDEQSQPFLGTYNMLSRSSAFDGDIRDIVALDASMDTAGTRLPGHPPTMTPFGATMTESQAQGLPQLMGTLDSIEFGEVTAAPLQSALRAEIDEAASPLRRRPSFLIKVIPTSGDGRADTSGMSTHTAVSRYAAAKTAASCFPATRVTLAKTGVVKVSAALPPIGRPARRNPLLKRSSWRQRRQQQKQQQQQQQLPESPASRAFDTAGDVSPTVDSSQTPDRSTTVRKSRCWAKDRKSIVGSGVVLVPGNALSRRHEEALRDLQRLLPSLHGPAG